MAQHVAGPEQAPVVSVMAMSAERKRAGASGFRLRAQSAHRAAHHCDVRPCTVCHNT